MVNGKWTKSKANKAGKPRAANKRPADCTPLSPIKCAISSRHCPKNGNNMMWVASTIKHLLFAAQTTKTDGRTGLSVWLQANHKPFPSIASIDVLTKKQAACKWFTGRFYVTQKQY